jgi:hypothetical protein
MRGEDRSDRFSHALPRSGMSSIGGCGKERLSDAKRERGQGSPLLTALQEGGNTT